MAAVAALQKQKIQQAALQQLRLLFAA